MATAALQWSVDTDAVRREWAARGFSCALWSDPPGQAWENYVHSTDELFMVLDGEVEIELGGVLLRPRPGEVVEIPRGVSHSVRNRGATASHWLYGYYG